MAKKTSFPIIEKSNFAKLTNTTYFTICRKGPRVPKFLLHFIFYKEQIYSIISWIGPIDFSNFGDRYNMNNNSKVAMFKEK